MAVPDKPTRTRSIEGCGHKGQRCQDLHQIADVCQVPLHNTLPRDVGQLCVQHLHGRVVHWSWNAVVLCSVMCSTSHITR